MEEYIRHLTTEQSVPWGWPSVLAKACSDPFNYKIGLKSGQVIKFTSAKPTAETWVWVDGSIDPEFSDRGTEISISEIAWIMDGR